MSKALTMEISDKGIVLDGVEMWPFDSMREEPYGYKIWLGDYPVEVKEGEEPKMRKAPTLMVYPKKGEAGIYEIMADMKFTVEGKPVEPDYYMVTGSPGRPYNVQVWVGGESKVGAVEIGKWKPVKPGKTFEAPKDEPMPIDPA